MGRYTGAEIAITLLERQAIRVVAGIPGGANLPLYDALQRSTIKHVLARHEQGAGFMAQGMARAVGLPAVCFATSGPGATNALTAIADAKLDSIPVVMITGQVPSKLIGTDAFQEIDTYGMTIPITKHNFLVQRAEDLLEVIPESFRIAAGGRPGPVVIDIPKDVQQTPIDVARWPEPAIPPAPPAPDARQVQAAAALICRSRRPVVFIGGGTLAEECGPLIVELAERIGAPIIPTLMGLGVVNPAHPHYMTMVGMHGQLRTNRLMQQADLVIALGVRFDDRATGKVDEFCPNARIIHVDIDASEIDKVLKSTVGVTADAALFLRAVLPMVSGSAVGADWRPAARKKSARRPAVEIPDAPEIIRGLGRILTEETIIATDVGQHQMWVAQHYPFRRPRTWLTSGGLGTMGFGVPAAMGAALAKPQTPVVCVSGDGSFLMNVQELATMAEEQLPVKIVIFNNGHLGLVRQQQELFYGGNYIASRFSHNPDFVKVARGFGVAGYRVEPNRRFFTRLRRYLQQPGPMVIDVPINSAENVLPMVIPGKGNQEVIGGSDNA